MDRQPADYDQLLASFLSGNTSSQEIEEIQRWQNLQTVIVREPYFFLKKSATLTLGDSSSGRNLLTNAVVAENGSTANIAVSGSILLKGGSVWATGGKSISFAPSTLALYTTNNSDAALTAFAAGVPTATADPIAGEGVYLQNRKRCQPDGDILWNDKSHKCRSGCRDGI